MRTGLLCQSSRTRTRKQWNEIHEDEDSMRTQRIPCLLGSPVYPTLMIYSLYIGTVSIQGHPKLNRFVPLCTKKTINCCKLNVKTVANNPQWSCRQEFCIINVHSHLKPEGWSRKDHFTKSGTKSLKKTTTFQILANTLRPACLFRWLIKAGTASLWLWLCLCFAVQ